MHKLNGHTDNTKSFLVTVLYVFHVEFAIEAFTNESISVVKVSRDGLVFRCLVGLPLDKWAQKCWPKLWEEMGILKDITFLELFPVVVALCIWGNSRFSYITCRINKPPAQRPTR
jgi:hypothetical protein